ncbi:hypothetical protein FA592_08225 [Sulfurospirillum diekertiae]|uniref:Uncharacterized protein n=1 Tax=Sulfurospirillum diekertiae TaxID=1854492 RepID=A0A6G9VS78_9BACT|nr:hypothetical protein [Sulfurospirillum diekertiae]QIR76220.1 hypothetical protein FA584_08370 [Sulfurospirillum diekertiae]QIR78849.1 hypothetical protein FA592_08225 [Sulfurospirillum diekertiae]
MKDKEREKYASVMNEIKRRTNVVYAFLNGERNAMYQAVNIELMCLQIRKILELIALSSLVANQKIFLRQVQNLKKMWNAKLILKDIERLNPDFYPNPIYEKPSDLEGVENDLINIKEGYLNKEDFIKAYDACGKILHAENPLGHKIDYKYYETNILIWMGKIKLLLNCHTIKLLNDNNLYVVHMQEQGKESSTVYVFELIKTLHL